MTVRILHNPRCSKSRATLALLQQRGIEPEIVLYLEQPPNPAELKSIVAKLGISVRDLLRRSEAEYQQLELDAQDLPDERLYAAIASHPRLLQRPIVLANGKAAIGRPPENVLAIL